MVAITIICVGALRDKFYREAADEYEKRLGAFCKLKTIETTDEKLASVIPQKAYKIALCVEGKMLSSEELADKIEQAQISGKSDLVFIIGSSYGLSDGVKQRADFRLSVSKLTFPHRLLRVMLYEAIYRSVSILNGSKYHK
jgi:23S rRNA (pseudouridine1915-N3)-methyltransferase